MQSDCGTVLFPFSHKPPLTAVYLVLNLLDPDNSILEEDGNLVLYCDGVVAFATDTAAGFLLRN